MVKIRAFISKKSVPRGIDIDNKEYWQPFGITIKGSNNGNGGGNGGENDNTGKCNITIITVPEDATIVATLPNGTIYTEKTFSVDKGSEITVVATPSTSSTGYKQTTKVITSNETNQDSLNYNLVLDTETIIQTTTVVINSNIEDITLEVYDSKNNKLNQNNSKIINNVKIGEIIRLIAFKQNYLLTASNVGILNVTDTNSSVAGINVVKDLIISLTFKNNEILTPSIRNIENEYLAFHPQQEFVRTFKSTFYKLEILPINNSLSVSLNTSWGTSSADGTGQSIIDSSKQHRTEQDVTFKISLPENTEASSRKLDFTLIAYNENDASFQKDFSIIQYSESESQDRVNVKLITKINGVVDNNSNIIRTINGENVSNDQSIEVPKGSTVVFYCKYLDKEYTESVVANENITKEFDFDVVNILLGTVNIDTYSLNLSVPSLGINRTWDGSAVPVIRNTIYYVTGIDTSGQRENYNSGEKRANGNQLNVVFSDLPTSIVRVVTNPQTANTTIKLKVGVVEYNNGSAFENGTKVGYVIISNDNRYETATLSDTSNNAIVAGVTQMPVVVDLVEKSQYVNVTINTTYNNVAATGAKIYLDSTYVGTGSPFILENLINGKSYNLRVELEGQNDITTAFVASLNKVVDVDFGSPSIIKRTITVKVVNPSTALIELTDVTDGQLYTGNGELIQQIEDGHEITIKYSNEGYIPKYIPSNAGEGGTVVVNQNMIYDNLTLDEIPPITNITYTLNVIPNDAKVEFSEDSINYEEYPSHKFVTLIGRTIYWRVTKEGYVGQTGNSGSLEGDKIDTVTLQQESPNVNNNVLFVINSIKDKDTDENLNDVVVNLKLKGINQQQNKTINQSDIQEVVNDSSLNQYIGKYGGVSSKGTSVEIVISKEGYDNYENSINIPVDYNDKLYVVNLVLEESKYIITFNPITNINGVSIIPDDIVVSENGNYTTINPIGNNNIYKYDAKKNSNINYIIRKEGYGTITDSVFVDSNKTIPIVMGQINTVIPQFSIIPNKIHIDNSCQIVSFDANCPEGWRINIKELFSDGKPHPILSEQEMIKQVIFYDKNTIAFEVKENTENQIRSRNITIAFVNNTSNDEIEKTITIVQYPSEFFGAVFQERVYENNETINVTISPLGESNVKSNIIRVCSKSWNIE